MKTLKELKLEHGKDLQTLKSFDDWKSLASNFIRMITWKKEKDLEYIERAYHGVLASVIKHIKNKGYDEALKEIKQNNLHKAYNIKYVYEWYGLNYDEAKAFIKNQKITIIGE